MKILSPKVSQFTVWLSIVLAYGLLIHNISGCGVMGVAFSCFNGYIGLYRIDFQHVFCAWVCPRWMRIWFCMYLNGCGNGCGLILIGVCLLLTQCRSASQPHVLPGQARTILFSVDNPQQWKEASFSKTPLPLTQQDIPSSVTSYCSLHQTTC